MSEKENKTLMDEFFGDDTSTAAPTEDTLLKYVEFIKSYAGQLKEMENALFETVDRVSDPVPTSAVVCFPCVAFPLVFSIILLVLYFFSDAACLQVENPITLDQIAYQRVHPINLINTDSRIFNKVMIVFVVLTSEMQQLAEFVSTSNSCFCSRCSCSLLLLFSFFSPL